MKLKKTVKILILSVLFTSALYGQEVLNNNAPSLKWKQVNTPDFRVIFPEGFEEEAQRVANTLQTVHGPLAMSYNFPKKISIVLRNQNAISNGFVTLGPRRSEFFTMPSQNNQFLGTNDWLDLLSVHEYRHIAQFQQSKTGFNKLFYYLFGENTQAGMAFTAAPPWFWEGDATMVETLYTRSGRGRIPEFSRVFKTNLLEKEKYNYHKQHLRSFKDFIPDHYRLGYHFNSYLRRSTHNPRIMELVSKNAFAWPFVPFTFSQSLKRHTGKKLVKNYDLMMDDLKQQWIKQQEELELSHFTTINKRHKDVFTDYSFPQVLSDGSMVVFKDGIGDPGHLVRLNESGEEVDNFYTGLMNNTGMLSATQHKVVWNEYYYHPRWGAEAYSIIKAYDFYEKELRTITRKSRYGGAAISPDGYKVATTLTTAENENHLIVIDYFTGEEINRFDNPDNEFYSMPHWTKDGDHIVALITTKAGRGVVLFDLKTGQKKTLIPSSDENIGYPRIAQGYLFYNSSISGIDNIYAMNLESRERFQVTSSKYGAYNATITDSGKSIVYNEHTVNGLDVVQTTFSQSEWVPIGKVKDRNLNDISEILEMGDYHNILDSVSTEVYPVKKYSKLGHMFNIHSWGPFATTDISKAEIGIFSKDVLSTTSASLGYTYDINEETGFATAGLSYQGWFPIIDFELQRGSRSSNEGVLNGDQVNFEWNETGIESGLRIPLNFTRSKFFTELELENKVGVRKITNFENSVLGGSRFAPINDSLAFFFRDAVNDGDLIFNRASISFFQLMKRSKRDINSRWGYSINLELFNTPYGGDFQGRLSASRINAYMPSPLRLFNNKLAKHHSLYFRFGSQSRLGELSNDLYYFRNRVPKPRGFAYPAHEKFTSFSVNYAMPLWYPDIALGPILNIQRIRLNGFADFGRGTGKNYFIEYQADDPRVFFSTLDENYQSVGGELFIDFNVMRFPLLITLGGRYSHLVTTGKSKIEFLIVNIAL